MACIGVRVERQVRLVADAQADELHTMPQCMFEIALEFAVDVWA